MGEITMEKKPYDGLNLTFVPIDGEEIITASPGYCNPIAIQYYIVDFTDSQCDSQDPTESGKIGYSYNLNREPDPNW